MIIKLERYDGDSFSGYSEFALLLEKFGKMFWGRMLKAVCHASLFGPRQTYLNGNGLFSPEEHLVGLRGECQGTNPMTAQGVNQRCFGPKHDICLVGRTLLSTIYEPRVLLNINSQISSKHFKPVMDTELIYQANEIFYLGLT